MKLGKIFVTAVFAVFTILCCVTDSICQQSELETAAAKGDLNKISAIVNDQTNINDIGKALLITITTGYRPNIVSFLTDSGRMKKLLENKTTEELVRVCMVFAVQKGDADIVEILLDRGAKVDGRTADLATLSDNWTPLMHAARTGKTYIGKTLLRYGANVNARNSKGETPLAIALKNTHTFFVQLIKDAGGTQ